MTDESKPATIPLWRKLKWIAADMRGRGFSETANILNEASDALRMATLDPEA